MQGEARAAEEGAGAAAGGARLPPALGGLCACVPVAATCLGHGFCYKYVFWQQQCSQQGLGHISRATSAGQLALV